MVYNLLSNIIRQISKYSIGFFELCNVFICQGLTDHIYKLFYQQLFRNRDMTFKKINKDNPLILASSSPRRKMLLEQIALPFHALPSSIDEKEEEGKPAEMVKKLAMKKAMDVQMLCHHNWILGADTLVVLNGIILGKPADYEQAGAMLHLLSGKMHEVITGFAIVDPIARLSHTDCVTTSVFIKHLSDRQISAYLDTREPFGKAGSYAIQGIGSFMVKEIKGSYSNVVGLPVCEVIESLVSVGALDGFPIPHHAG